VANFRAISETLCAYLAKINCISEFLSQRYMIWKIKRNHPNRSSYEGDIVDLKSVIFQNFGDVRKILQNLNLLSECPNFCSDFTIKCRAVVLVPKIGYNKNYELYWASYAHFKFRVQNPRLQEEVGDFFSNPSYNFEDMENKRYFTGNDDGVSIEEYIKHIKLQLEE